MEDSFSSQKLEAFGHTKPSISIRLLMLMASRTAFKLISPFVSNIILFMLPYFIYILSRKKSKKEWQPCISFFMWLSDVVSFHDISLPTRLLKFLLWFKHCYMTSKNLLLHSTRWDELLSRKMKNSISYLFEALVTILSLAKQNTPASF